jgi:hypothetical protein
MAKKRTRKLQIGVVVLAIAAAIGGGLVESVKDSAKSVASRALSWAQNRIEDLVPPEVPKAREPRALAILVAQLGGDHDGSQTALVHRSLRRALDLGDKGRDVQVLTVGRVLKLGGSSDVWQQRKEAERVGREWLKRSGAELLIWGNVPGNKVMHINFLLDEGETTPKEDPLPIKGQKLKKTKRKLCVVGPL